MHHLRFTTTGVFDQTQDFGCASLGLAGTCENTAVYERPLRGTVLTGTYEQILKAAKEIAGSESIHAAVVLFGNAGGENEFLRQLQTVVSCPMVGGGAAIDGATGKAGLITGGGQAAVFLIQDDRYTFRAVTQCIHDQLLEDCVLTMEDLRTVLTINGTDAAQFLARKKAQLGLAETDFEHLTLTDISGVNAHLSLAEGKIKSGRDLCTQMQLRYVAHEKVYDRMREFYNDPDAIVFGCAGLSGLLDRPLDTTSLGLFLFGEVCTVENHAEFGNLMLSKLQIIPK